MGDLYYHILQNATVFFLFISGFLFHYLFNPQEKAGEFYTKKLKRLVLPYLAASAVALGIEGVTKGALPDLRTLVWNLITGTVPNNVGHWFIPTMVLIFLSYPLLRFLVSRPTILTWAAAAGIVVSALTFRSAGNGNPLVNALHFYGIFLLGMALSAHWKTLSALLRKHFWVVLVAGSALFAGLTYLVAATPFLDMDLVLSGAGWAPNWSLIARVVALFPLLAVLIKLSDLGFHLKYLSITGKMSFGIFFYHGYIILGLNSPWVNSFLPQTSLWVLGLNALIVLGSLWLLLTGVKKVLGKSSVYLTGY